MGTGVFGGMLVATFVAPIFVPLFFALLARKPRPVHGEPPTPTPKHQPPAEPLS
jgi:multidrug efflux pump